MIADAVRYQFIQNMHSTQTGLSVPQRSEKWFDARKRCLITSSRACEAQDPKNWPTLTGQKERSLPPDHILQWGTNHEDDGVEAFLAKRSPYGKFCVPGFLVHPDCRSVGGSPDGLFFDGPSGYTVLEVKCPCDFRMNHRLPDKPREHHQYQLWLNACIMGRILNLDRIGAALIYWTPDGTREWSWDIDVPKHSQRILSQLSAFLEYAAKIRRDKFKL